MAGGRNRQKARRAKMWGEDEPKSNVKAKRDTCPCHESILCPDDWPDEMEELEDYYLAEYERP